MPTNVGLHGVGDNVAYCARVSVCLCSCG